MKRHCTIHYTPPRRGPSPRTKALVALLQIILVGGTLALFIAGILNSLHA